MAAFGFYASAAVAVLAGLAAVLVRRSDRALAGFAVAMAALLVPLVQLQATAVAAALLLAAGVGVVLLAALAGPRLPQGRAPLSYTILAGLGVAGFAWVLLATGSRQVVDRGEPRLAGEFGDPNALLLELGTAFVIPATLVGLLALCAVIAAVLTLAPALTGRRP